MYLNYQHFLADKAHLDCTFYVEDPELATRDEPGDPGCFILESVKANGIEIIDLLSYSTVQHIEQCADIAFATMGDEDFDIPEDDL